MMLTFVYAAGAAALLGLPADYTWCRAGSWPHSSRLSLRPLSSALSPWPPALACCTAPRGRRRLIFGFIGGGAGAGAVPSRRCGMDPGATPGRFSELRKSQDPVA